MACNCNNNQPRGPPPPLERQNYPPAPPPTPIIQETRPADTRIVLEEDFSFPVVAKVMPEDVKNENPKEASGGSRKRKAN
ncbi:hypothetical protein AAZX31_06G115900 [Glycine max]|uniref:Uncharacterized protein n=1 Tax=Glycine max TaxID=3847 RepID=K7KUN0_SOYBN|nr:hypothetical protein JHK85_015447 [Glycine max]KAG5045685.1 hypothetical protein JHK86_015091 [Glycine max]KAG5148191.1 hypothetical protein JHK82_015072 [Glycine max]KAH1125499.1 hypothetical protein GYH30_014870 [Glycine max]KAH1245453.1 hypothetical protein GmHk_06G015791 [Glycine max]